MKKTLLVTLLLLLAASTVFAQFGIKGGLNLATFGGDDKNLDPAVVGLTGIPAIAPTHRTGFVAGVSYKIGLPLISIQPEVLYAQKGAVYEISQVQVKATLKNDYIDIPVVVRFSPLPLPILSPYIEAGLSYSILLSAKETDESPAGSQETDNKDAMSKNDLSFLVGIGVELAMLDINARYVIGQTGVMKDVGNVSPKIYNRGIMLTAGIRF